MLQWFVEMWNANTLFWWQGGIVLVELTQSLRYLSKFAASNPSPIRVKGILVLFFNLIFFQKQCLCYFFGRKYSENWKLMQTINRYG